MTRISGSLKSIEDEWLIESQKSFQFGISRFAIPIAFFFTIFDLIFFNDQAQLMLGCRLLMIPIIFIGSYFLKKTTSKQQFIRIYLVTLAAFVIIQTALIYITNEPTQMYFLGLITVATGVFSFVKLPTKHFITANIIIFLPYFIISASTGFFQKYPMHYSAYFFNTFSLIIIFDYFRRNSILTKIEEYNLRKSLNDLLINRDQDVSTMADSLSRAIEAENTRSAEYTNKESYYKFARQITHDLRSPLTALQAISKNIKNTDPETIDLFKSCIDRITDIADSLSTQFQVENIKNASFSKEELATTIHYLIKEKRQHSLNLKKDIDITFLNNITKMSHLKFDKVQFSNIISNIMDNAIDAIESVGKIAVIASNDSSGFIDVTIQDNGKGIPENILFNLGTYGFSYNKEKGTGIALATAKRLLNYRGGELVIESELNKFTRVIVRIPISVD